MTFVELIKKVLLSTTTAEEFSWLENSIAGGKDNERALQVAFIVVPKFIKNKRIVLDTEFKKQFAVKIGFIPDNWTSHLLARIFIVLHFDPENELNYKNRITTLFETAEVNELVALQSALPFFHYPKVWIPFAVEAVRSNVGTVFDAIAFNNPYPAKYFNEAAWNQMVLKTIFNGKDIKQIVGLKIRSNKELAYMITDFASERWAAQRTVSPHIWTLVTPFIDEALISRLEKLFQSGKGNFSKNSGFEPVQDILKKYSYQVNV